MKTNLSRRSTILVTVLFGMALASLAGPGRAGTTLRAAATTPADLVLTSGDVYTVDPARPAAQAVAVRHGRILAVGSDAEIRKFIGPKTRVIDLGGRFAMPGFNDAHTHLGSAGAAKIESICAVRGRCVNFRTASGRRSGGTSPANGFWARVGTRRSGRERNIRRGRTWTPSAARTRFFSREWMDTAPWPIRSR